MAHWTAREYLAYERASEMKHELIDGVVYASLGERFNHGRVVGAAGVALANLLDGTPCEVLFSGMRVYIEAEEMLMSASPAAGLRCLMIGTRTTCSIPRL